MAFVTEYLLQDGIALPSLHPKSTSSDVVRLINVLILTLAHTAMASLSSLPDDLICYISVLIHLLCLLTYALVNMRIFSCSEKTKTTS